MDRGAWQAIVHQFSSVQSLSRIRLFATPWTTAHQASLSITNSRVHPNPCPLNQWCHPTISSSVIPFSSCPQSSPASESFQMSQLFASGGQSIGVSASTSVLSMNNQEWSPLGWTGWVSLQSKGLLAFHSQILICYSLTISPEKYLENLLSKKVCVFFLMTQRRNELSLPLSPDFVLGVPSQYRSESTQSLPTG